MTDTADSNFRLNFVKPKAKLQQRSIRLKQDHVSRGQRELNVKISKLPGGWEKPVGASHDWL